MTEFPLRRPYRRRNSRTREAKSEEGGGYLYGAPPIIAGEAVSGWIWRIAGSQCCRNSHILALVGWRLTAHEFDFARAPVVVERLAHLTLSDSRAIGEAQARGGPLLEHPSLLGLTSDHGSSVPIYRYCPYCLRNDRVAYFRYIWRTAFTFACERHRVALRDSCPSCARRVDFSTSKAQRGAVDGSRLMAQCPECGFELSHAESVSSVESLITVLLSRQRFLQRIISQGFIRHPKLGTISALGVVESFLAPPPNLGETAVGARGLDFARLFGPWADDLRAWLGKTMQLT